MSEDPKITVRKLSYFLPVESLGTDDQGLLARLTDMLGGRDGVA